MKDRILKGWNIRRGLYLVVGLFVVFQAIATEQWIGILLGIYFTSMGIFAYGCASGNCYGDSCSTKPGKKDQP